MDKKIEKAVEILKKGGIGIFPTDTVLGLGTVAKREYVEKVYKIKNRDFSKKIISLISNIDILDDIVDLDLKENKDIFRVLKKYWPGELTVIFKGKREFLNKFDTTMETIGVRIPKNDTALGIIEGVGGILLTTSANMSGKSSCVKIEDIDEELKKNVDFIINGNDILTGIPSTIIEYREGKVILVREGNIPFGEILKEMKG